ncbi:MAG: phosphatidate cytidylyltransferase [Spirochaetales bacterium]|nr:phosphatidate cytidylyltransferase [Spirochaetales bacterium]
MKKLLKRLLLVVIALPILLVSIILLPEYNFFLLSSIMVIMAALAGFELARLFNSAGIEIDIASTSAIAATTVILTYVYSIDLINLNIFALLLFLILIFQLATAIINKTNNWENTASKVLARVFAVIYTGILPATVLLIGKLDLPIYGLLFFFALVFANDTFAYLVGMTIGRFTPKPFKVSPNKSVAGFIGGLAGTIGIGIACYYIKSDFFEKNILNVIVISIGIFILGTAGDLFESALKRSANIKDSGKIMLGRGGVLDSIDSIVFSAPFFYLLMKIIQG